MSEIEIPVPVWTLYGICILGHMNAMAQAGEKEELERLKDVYQMHAKYCTVCGEKIVKYKIEQLPKPEEMEREIEEAVEEIAEKRKEIETPEMDLVIITSEKVRFVIGNEYWEVEIPYYGASKKEWADRIAEILEGGPDYVRTWGTLIPFNKLDEDVLLYSSKGRERMLNIFYRFHPEWKGKIKLYKLVS